MTNPSTPSPKKDLHVLIIGAGTTGLLLAQGLKKNNISFSIFESETPDTYLTRPREWGMTLHWGASHVAACLPPHLVDRFHEAYADPGQKPDAVSGLPIYNGKTGECIMHMAADKPCRVSRKKMRKLFGEGIDVQYGKSIVHAEVVDVDGAERVRVKFADDTEVQGDILVGCDGAKSRVRAVICGEEEAKLTDVPVRMFNFPYKFDADTAGRIRAMNQLFITSIHPEHGSMFWLSIQDVPPTTSTNPSTYTFQVLLSFLTTSVPAGTDLTTQPGRMSFFKSRASTYAEPWRSAALQIDPNTYLPLDSGTYWSRAAPWDNRKGRMTLCGDAAHPMTPHRGQGLNNALLDASSMVEMMRKVVFGGEELEVCVGKYDEKVLARGKEEMAVSLKQTMFIHDWETLMESPMVKIGMRQIRVGDAEA